MFYLGKFIKNVKDFYGEINSATLTGAIDVIVVEQPDGSFLSSPFHVRFGKMGVLRAREKIVDIEINGEAVKINMKLGDSGEAFFVEEVIEEEYDVPEHLATSPIPDDDLMSVGHPVDDLAREIEQLTTRAAGTCPSLPVDIHPYSDGEMSPIECGSPPDRISHLSQRPATPVSDSEYEISRDHSERLANAVVDDKESVTWGWGEMPRVPLSHSRKPSTTSNTITAFTTQANSQSQTPHHSNSSNMMSHSNSSSNNIHNSSNNNNYNNSSSSNNNGNNSDEVSGSIPVPSSGGPRSGDWTLDMDESEVVVSDSMINVLIEEKAKSERDSNYGSGGEDPASPISSPGDCDHESARSPRSPQSPGSPVSPVSPQSDDNEGCASEGGASGGVSVLTNSSSSSGGGGGTGSGAGGKQRRRRKRNHYRKVLRLTSDQISSLNLCYGANDAVFSVTTAYQGTTKCHCQIYYWNFDDKIVISDIDGTITKSDVLGHILPIIGRDWAQSGVTNLFTKIHDNGYKFIYLSARAIGQATTTRDYLRSVKQGDVCLPDGPLLLSPTSLISAFHREVIEKRPEDFKISCLKDIQALFPDNPFYAGFGNKINDTWAYRAVSIHLSRIFTVNHRGELKLELIQTFQSSYTRLSDVVDQMFPPLEYEAKDENFLSDFSSFNYWKEPIAMITDEDELMKSLLECK